MLRLFFCSFAFLLVPLFAAAQEVNSILLRKADTHFENGEWREAAAMFNVLINESPAVLELYPYAVASNDLGGDAKGVMAAVELSEKNGISLDSLFLKTKLLCTALGYNGVYERMLLCIKREQPWFKRMVNKYLLRFYMERKENLKAIGIVDEVLSSSPDNLTLLNAKASILTDCGDLTGAAACMERVLDIDSSAWEARLFLGNYYFLKGMELYDLGGVSSSEESNPGFPALPDSANYGNEARALFLRAVELLDTDSAVFNTPYVRNTVRVMRDKLKVLSVF